MFLFYHKGSYTYTLVDYGDILKQHCPFIIEDILLFLFAISFCDQKFVEHYKLKQKYRINSYSRFCALVTL